MQATSNATLFQTSYSEALGAYRSRKAILTSGISPSPSSPNFSSSAAARYGFPIHLNPQFTSALISNPEDLAVEGSGADGGRYRVLCLRVAAGFLWSAEAGGVVRQMDLESGKTANLYKGAKGPVPSFDFIETTAGEKLLATGSWDKAVRVYRISEGTEKGAGEPILTVEAAMTDFIKAVHIFAEGEKLYLATGGSDKSICLWDCSPLTLLSTSSTTAGGALKCVYQSKVHTRPVNALTSINGLDGITRLYSADSMGRILEHTLNPTSLRLEVCREIQGFSTAVYDLKASWRRVLVEGERKQEGGDPFKSEVREDEDGSRFRLVAEIWGASGDKTALGFRLSSALQPPSSPAATKSRSGGGSNPLLGREEPVTTPQVKLVHKDFVKAILPLPFYLPTPNLPQFDPFEEAVVTGGSDEHLRLFPSASTSSSSSFRTEEEEQVEVEGHWHEIISLACWTRHPNPSPTTTTSPLPPATKVEIWIISASLDGTIRRWNLLTIPTLPKPELKPVLEKDHQPNLDWGEDSLPPLTKKNLLGENAVVGGGAGSGAGKAMQMTAEEEAELAELMDSDDE